MSKKLGIKYLLETKIIEKLNEYDVNYDDNTELMKNKKDEQIYNIKYDAKHWNALGAFYGINAALENLNKQKALIKPNQKSDFMVTEVLQKKTNEL